MPQPLSVVLTAALVPLTLALPVVSAPAAAAAPVRPVVVEQPVDGVDRAAAAEGGAAAPTALTARRSTGRFSAVGVTWAADPAVAAVAVQVRTRTGGRWSAWSALESETAPEADSAEGRRTTRVGTDPLWVGPSDGVQVRVDAAGRRPQQVRVALIDPGSSPADASLGRSGVLGGAVAEAAETAPAYVSRAQWGADESLRNCAPTYSSGLKAAVVHNTATRNAYTAAESPAIMRSMYAYHTQTLGWCDLGYQFTVDRFGTLFEGRAGGVARPVLGSHAGGFNASTVGVSSIGNHDLEAPTAAAVSTIARLLAWKLGLHGLDPRGTVALTSAGGASKYAAGTVVRANVISGHRDFSYKSCPGSLFYPLLGGLRETVAARMAVSGSGSLSAAPVQASALSLRPSVPAVTYGSALTLSGRLTSGREGVAGQPVTLHVRRRGTTTWLPQTTVTTRSDGTWSAPHRPTVNHEYAARYAGRTGERAPASSPVARVDVRTAVTAALSASSVRRGTTVRLTGRVTPAHPGQSVLRQAYVDGAWRTWATATLSATGTYAFAITSRSPATLTYRVVKPADADHATGVSATRVLRVS